VNADSDVIADNDRQRATCNHNRNFRASIGCYFTLNLSDRSLGRRPRTRRNGEKRIVLRNSALLSDLRTPSSIPPRNPKTRNGRLRDCHLYGDRASCWLWHAIAPNAARLTSLASGLSFRASWVGAKCRGTATPDSGEWASNGIHHPLWCAFAREVGKIQERAPR
jgi:hypothetical protein